MIREDTNFEVFNYIQHENGSEEIKHIEEGCDTSEQRKRDMAGKIRWIVNNEIANCVLMLGNVNIQRNPIILIYMYIIILLDFKHLIFIIV